MANPREQGGTDWGKVGAVAGVVSVLIALMALPSQVSWIRELVPGRGSTVEVSPSTESGASPTSGAGSGDATPSADSTPEGGSADSASGNGASDGSAPTRVEVPMVVGLSVADAMDALADARLVGQVAPWPLNSTPVTSDQVSSTMPAAGFEVMPGSLVMLLLSANGWG
ncbi:MAG: PASTA domain-containing protein [Kineosporiaceae bacterium]|nr:PASTA domain-containing protein [Kineosporiaceae bacterium]